MADLVEGFRTVILRPTVLVLGAGASACFGFPTGYQLFEQVASDPGGGRDGTIALELVQRGYDPNQVRSFVRALRHSGLTSVDSFLEHRPEFLEVGKAAIARALIPCEAHTALYERRTGPSWYDYLYARLAAPPDRFAENKLSVLTFNYDRSFEYYLFTALSNTHNLSERDAAALVEKLPIVHLYGQLGTLRELDGVGRGYRPDVETDSIKVAAAGIRIITEPERDDARFKQAWELLSTAETIRFLGFGYDPTNIERLRKNAHFRTKNFFGSALGLSQREKEATARLMPIQFPPSEGDCLALLRAAPALE